MLSYPGGTVHGTLADHPTANEPASEALCRVCVGVRVWVCCWQVFPLDAYETVVAHRPQINPDTLWTHGKVKEAHQFYLTQVLD